MFTRKELYDLVWSTPMTTIAKKYLISDVGLRKICISQGIPLPRAGHWMKIKAGKQEEAAPLPPKGDDKGEVVLNIRTLNDPTPSQKDPVRALAKELINQNILFSVPDTLTSQDPRIVKAQNALTEKQYLHRGLASSSSGILSISVSPPNVHRALCFMQGLISVLEARGHQLQVKSSQTEVIISGQTMTISLREKLKITRSPNKWGSYDNDYEPEGSLILKLEIYGTKEWQDGSKKLEAQLPEIVARMEVEAQKAIQRELEWKKREEQRKEEENLLRVRKQQKKLELDGFKNLIMSAERWNAVQQMRNYINEVERRAQETNTLTDELKEWINWAQQKVDWYDPFINAKDEFLNDEDKNNIFAQERTSTYGSFNQPPDIPYFPRPWYTSRNR